MHEDPLDNLKSISNGCRLLSYRKDPKGSSVTVYKDISREFFIILSGRIGIFIPRPESAILEELEAIHFLYKASGLTLEKDLKREGLVRIHSKLEPNHRFKSYPLRYDLISTQNNKVTYNAEYFASVCGRISPGDIISEPQFLLDNKVHVLKFS